MLGYIYVRVLLSLAVIFSCVSQQQSYAQPTTPTPTILLGENLCYSASSQSGFARFFLSQQIVGLSKFTIEYQSGWVTCNDDDSSCTANFGCACNWYLYCEVIALSDGTLLVPDSDDPDVVFPTSENLNLKMFRIDRVGDIYSPSKSYFSLLLIPPQTLWRGTELRLYYGQSYAGSSLANNAGVTCAKVYAEGVAIPPPAHLSNIGPQNYSLIAENVCYSAKGKSNYGKFFVLQEWYSVVGFKIEYRSGAVSCNTGAASCSGHFGCSCGSTFREVITSADETVILPDPPDSPDVLIPSRSMWNNVYEYGLDLPTADLQNFKDISSFTLYLPEPRALPPKMELRLYYGEALAGIDDDNDGTTCVDVYGIGVLGPTRTVSPTVSASIPSLTESAYTASHSRTSKSIGSLTSSIIVSSTHTDGTGSRSASGSPSRTSSRSKRSHSLSRTPDTVSSSANASSTMSFSPSTTVGSPTSSGNTSFSLSRSPSVTPRTASLYTPPRSGTRSNSRTSTASFFSSSVSSFTPSTSASLNLSRTTTDAISVSLNLSRTTSALTITNTIPTTFSQSLLPTITERPCSLISPLNNSCMALQYSQSGTPNVTFKSLSGATLPPTEQDVLSMCKSGLPLPPLFSISYNEFQKNAPWNLTIPLDLDLRNAEGTVNVEYLEVSGDPRTRLSALNDSTPSVLRLRVESSFEKDLRDDTVLSIILSPESFQCSTLLPSLFNFTFAVRTDYVISPEVQRAMTETGGVAGVLSSFVGNPALALQLSKVSSILELLECHFNLNESLDVATNPLRLSISPETCQHFRGAVVGNMLLFVGVVLIFLFFGLLLATYRYRKKKRNAGGLPPSSFRSCLSLALADLHFPGVCIVPAALGLEGTVSASTSLFVHGVNGFDTMLGTVGITAAGAFLLWFHFVLRELTFACKLEDRSSEEKEEEKKENEGESEMEVLVSSNPSTGRATFELGNKKSSRSSFLRVLTSVFASRYHWVPKDENRLWKKQYMLLFHVYRMRTYVGIELTSSALLGVLDGVKIANETFCKTVTFLIFSCFVLLLILCIVKRPGLSPFENFYLISLYFLSAVSVLVIILYSFYDDPKLLAASQIMSVICLAVGIAKFIEDIVAFILWGVAHRRKRKQRENRDEEMLTQPMLVLVESDDKNDEGGEKEQESHVQREEEVASSSSNSTAPPPDSPSNHDDDDDLEQFVANTLSTRVDDFTVQRRERAVVTHNALLDTSTEIPMEEGTISFAPLDESTEADAVIDEILNDGNEDECGERSPTLETSDYDDFI